ncbi:MAG: hypothetical protein N2203_06500 [Bacteroidia bacterium]|nr:hypothetical protein [Bacteroidia bacterium]
MKVAVIDLGTNTFNLMISEYNHHHFQILYSDKYPVKLGQKIAEQHTIDASGIERIKKVLSLYSDIITKHHVDETIALATSSIRTAKNQKEILNLIKDQFKIHVQVIDGEREAELIYLANQFAIKKCMIAASYPVLIMDIGGGSTEFIISDEKNLLWKKSFLLGMARIIDEIKPHDPILHSDIENIHDYLDKILEPLIRQFHIFKPQALVGSSGVFDSIVEMIEANIRPLNRTESCCVITQHDFNQIYHDILPLPYSERLKYKGLIPMRADMVVVSFVLIDYILKKFSFENIIISHYSLKEGVVIEKLSQK